jgi:CubicO group peptidase (beta-lactamase class C family)
MGAIIEVVSGMDYFDYIRENIYKRVGMKNSDSFDRDGPADNLAVGYTNMNNLATDNEKYAWSNAYILSPRGTPAGGGYSTTGDLLKFDNALRSYKLLNQAYTHFLFNRWEGSPEDDPGLPLRISRTAGGAPGVSADIARDFKHGYTIIVLSNYDFPVANEVAAEIIEDLGLL